MNGDGVVSPEDRIQIANFPQRRNYYHENSSVRQNKKPLLGGTSASTISFPKRLSLFPFHASDLPLQKLGNGVESSGNTGNGHVHHVGHGGAGAGGAGGTTAGASRGTGLAVGGGGVVGDLLALVGTPDGAVLLELLEGAAAELAVGALQVETTVDFLEGAHLNTVARLVRWT